MEIMRECTSCERRTVLAIITDHVEAERAYREYARKTQPSCGTCGEPDPAVILRDIYGKVAQSSAARD